MPISVAAAQAHVKIWSANLAPYASRKGWPSKLFHACQVEVAAKILADGHLKSRNDAGEIICDVANQSALWNNEDAHNYVRLYFRPRNSFHLKTEGIKRRTNPHRRDPHMSIPVMLVFDLERVLTSDFAFFLPSNFAHFGAVPQNGDGAFTNLDFTKIYHDSATNAQNRQEIHDARMAEVVCSAPLPLTFLSAVVCRTVHELETLRAMISPGTRDYHMTVEQNGSLFMRKETYVTEIYAHGGIIHVSLAQWFAANNPLEFRLSSQEGDFSGTLPSSKVHFPNFRASDPNTVWSLEIEGCLAFRAKIPWTAGLV